ncbi:MAG: hypothetical protein HRU23_19835 [Gammaproteobacteria bacterium]|nr:hypothetical protein [Gammaproteobacteria bacterium]
MIKTSHILLVLVTLTLTACKTTSIREFSNEQTSKTMQAVNQPAADYPPPSASQLRMYIFTGFDDLDKKNHQRQGYFIDFETNSQPRK